MADEEFPAEEEVDPDTKEENPYDKKSREKMLEDDEINDWEEGVLDGYESDEEETEEETEDI
jgi:hypothetical protein